ncbi:MAG: DUF4846 domain-containing protein [Eubacteriaceae bacterium]
MRKKTITFIIMIIIVLILSQWHFILQFIQQNLFINNKYINEEGMTIEERFILPEGYERISVEEGSFASYLRSLPVRSYDTPVRYYNGKQKLNSSHISIVDMEIVDDKDIEQCADVVMHLRADYLYNRGEYDRIHYNITNGFRVDYSKWIEGYRINVTGNETQWIKTSNPANTTDIFESYLEMIYMYAGTLSLSKEMQSIFLQQMNIGDVFMRGGTPGHIEIIVDMAINARTGDKIFLLAQGSTPAQDMHILKNLENKSLSPWYSINFGEELKTPEYTFTKDELMRFID